ncbi:MAG: hypothetical protein IT236_15770 [Bacteroidia bacterium]|nr:hypothetical protein [Bacteroidia bacterium]
MENSINPQSHGIRWANGVLFAGLCFLIFFIASQLQKGFELSDESYYVLASQYPNSSKALNSLFGLVNSKFTFGCTQLLALRIFKLIYQSLSLIIFSLAFTRFLKTNNKVNTQQQLLIFITCCLSGFINYDYLPMALSYNSWSFNFSLIFLAAIVYLSSVKITATGFWLASASVGFSLFVLAYVKTPNALISGFLFLVYVIIFHFKNLVKISLAALAGAVLCLFLLFGNIHAFTEKTSELYINLTTVKHTSFGAYGKDLTDLIQFFGAKQFCIYLLLLLAMYLIRKKNKNLWPAILVIGLHAMQGLQFIMGNSNNIINDFMFGFWLLINALLLVVLLYNKNTFIFAKQNIFITSLLLIMPIGMALGTSNPLVYTTSHYFMFLVAAMCYVITQLGNNKAWIYLTFTSALLLVFVTGVVYQGMYKTPYRQTALSEKTIPLSFTGFHTSIHEDSARLVFLQEMVSKLKKYNAAGNPVLASPPCLGAITLAKMQPLEVVWLADNENDVAVNEAFLKQVNNQKTIPFLLISGRIKNSEIQYQVFKKYGLDFKNNSVLRDSIYLSDNKEYAYYLSNIAR